MSPFGRIPNRFRNLRGANFASLWLVASVSLLTLSVFGVFPACSLASLLSNDHSLSEPFLRYLYRAQWTLTFLALALWPLFLVPNRIRSGLDFLLRRLSNRLFLLGIALGAFAVTLVVQTWLFQGIPHVTDAISHLFQAKIFSLGRLWVSAPPCFEHFIQFNIYITSDGRWFSAYPPGHALTLLPALWLHVLPLYGPVCTSVSLLTCTWIVGRFYGQAFSRVFALLGLLSPMAILIGGSYMSHISLMLCVSLSLALGIYAVDRIHALRSAFTAFWGAGLLLSFAMLIRPQDVVVLAPPIALGLLLTWRKLQPVWRTAIPALLLGAIIPAAILFFWNNRVFGSPFVLGYGRTGVESLTHILVPKFGFSDSFTFPQAVQQLIWSLDRLNSVLLGWPLALPLVAVAVLRWPLDRRDLVCLTALAASFALFFSYDYYGLEYEARFYAAVAPAIVVLAARGLVQLHRWLRSGPSVPMLVLLLTLYAFIHYWPCYIAPNYSQDYEQVSTLLHRKVRLNDLADSLVLVPSDAANQFRYSSGFLYNDPLLENEVIFARDLPEKNNCLFEAFPRRSIVRFLPNDDWSDGQFVPVTRDPLEKRFLP